MGSDTHTVGVGLLLAALLVSGSGACAFADQGGKKPPIRPRAHSPAVTKALRLMSHVWPWRGTVAGHEERPRIMRVIARLSAYDDAVLRKVMVEVEKRTAEGDIDLIDNALLLNRYIFKTPRYIPTPTYPDHEKGPPIRAYWLNTEGRVSDVLFPFSIGKGGRLELTGAIEGGSSGTHWFPIVKEFDYLRSKYGRRKRPGWVEGAVDEPGANPPSNGP